MPSWGWGLSPRVRGNLEHSSRQRENLGSIPACAGEPGPAPRGRPCYCGLSPRVRGNRFTEHVYGGANGSIPACAGEPLLPESRQERPRVYPRVCGGTMFDKEKSDRCYGLSPRVRGNPLRESMPCLSHGSIPACAGEPCSTRRSQIDATVYPRVCGGTRSENPCLV